MTTVSLGWLCDAWPQHPEVRIAPIGDLVDHEPEDCPCGPHVEPVPRENGSMGWMVVHASLDGREGSE